MGRTKRKKLFKGVYEDKAGVSVIVSVRGKPREFRKDSNGKPYSQYERHALRDEPTKVKARELQVAELDAIRAGSFAEDVQRYLKTISSESHRKNSVGYMAHWERAFADKHRSDITTLDVQQAFAAIDKKPSTKNHIRHALIDFFATLNGKAGDNPARVLQKVRERYDDARALSYDIIEQIFNALEPTPTKARLMIMAYAGLPPAQIERLTKHDLRLDQQAVYVKPRRKGAGVPGKLVPLSPKGVTAFQLLDSLRAYGTFQRKQLQNTLQVGIERSGVTVPPWTRPYDLRHSFLTEVYRQTGDLKAVSELGLHATLEQTGRYARGAVSERATKAIASVPRFRATRNTRTNVKALTTTKPPMTGKRRQQATNTRAKPSKSSR